VLPQTRAVKSGSLQRVVTPQSQLLQTCAEAEHHLGHACSLKDQHIAKAVERRSRLTHRGAFAVKAGDSSDTMASFYHEMLGSGWQKWDLGPGPATELEKLIPAQKAGA
jgi:hypothetical protein